MVCNKCGFENKTDAIYCENCGRNLRKTSKVTIAETNKAIFIIPILLFLLVGICFAFFNSLSKDKSYDKSIPQSQQIINEEGVDFSDLNKIDKDISKLCVNNISDDGVKYGDLVKQVGDKMLDFDLYLNDEKFYEAYKIILDFKKQGVGDEDLKALHNNFEGALNKRLDENATYNDYGNSVLILQELLELEPNNEFFKGLLDEAEGNSKIWRR